MIKDIFILKGLFNILNFILNLFLDDIEKHLKRPISVSFEIPYFSVSGIQVRYLKITEKSGYEAIPWVRYITQNGDFNIRIL